MQLVYLNADPGVPVLGPKGASVHVREMLLALAPRVDGLIAVTARLLPRRERDRIAVPARAMPPCPAIELTSDADGASPDALTTDTRADRALHALRDVGRLDAIYERYSLGSAAGARAAGRWRVPWILEVNAPLVDEAARHRGRSSDVAARDVERRLFACASRVVAVSDEVRAHVVSSGADPARVTVLPNGYRDSLFRGKPRARTEYRPFTVVFVGSLKPWHGLDVLVEGFRRLHAKHDDCRLVVVGDGPLRADLEARARGALPGSVFRFVGAVPHEHVPRFLAEAHVAVAPYPALGPFYFSPLKLVEYCAMGLPIVASRLGQIELLVDGESALLVEPGSPDALARALIRLREEPDLREKLGRAARRAAAGRSWGAIASRVVELLEAERALPARQGIPT